MARWRRDATDIEKAAVLSILCATEDEVVMQNCLTVFVMEGLPVLQDEVISLLEHPCESVQWLSALVLSFHRDERLRQYGLGRLDDDLHLALLLLCNSVEVCDYALIAERVTGCETDDPHAIDSALVDMMKGAGDGSDPFLLAYVYEHSMCSVCRHEAVRLLIEKDACADWIRDECRHDCREETRRLVAG